MFVYKIKQRYILDRWSLNSSKTNRIWHFKYFNNIMLFRKVKTSDPGNTNLLQSRIMDIKEPPYGTCFLSGKIWAKKLSLSQLRHYTVQIEQWNGYLSLLLRLPSSNSVVLLLNFWIEFECQIVSYNMLPPHVLNSLLITRCIQETNRYLSERELLAIFPLFHSSKTLQGDLVFGGSSRMWFSLCLCVSLCVCLSLMFCVLGQVESLSLWVS